MTAPHIVRWDAASASDLHGEVVWCEDFFACKKAILDLVTHAKQSIYMSCFLCDVDESLGCTDEEKQSVPSLRHCLLEAVARGVNVNILYNPETCYGNESEATFSAKVPGCNVRCVRGDLGPAPWMLYLSSNSKWSYHHQKYLAVDQQRMMVTGCDVNGERSGWMFKNKLNYYWHELSVVVPMSPRMADFVRENFQRICSPPFPLLNGRAEHDVMVSLVDTARESVHLENQAFMSAGPTRCRLAEVLAQRVACAVHAREKFHVLIFTNVAQQDEPSQLVRAYCALGTSWGWNYIASRTAALGVSADELRQHIFFGCMRRGTTLVKVHSNVLIVDSVRAIRSSSNLGDRSLSQFPSDTELGVYVTKGVAEFQQRLFNNYLGTIGREYTVEEVFQLAQHEVGVMRRVVPLRLPAWTVRAVMSAVHHFPATGGKKQVTWTITPANAPRPVHKRFEYSSNAFVILALLVLLLLVRFVGEV